MTGLLVAFALGALFAVGLGVGGMTLPSKIIAFLDVTGAWDPSLALVLGGAVVTYAVVYRIAARRGRPVLGADFTTPAHAGIDARLIGGAAIFGIGWGMSGFCPGPAIVALVTGNPSVWVFVGAMAAGMWLHDGLARMRRDAAKPIQIEPAPAADG